MKRAAPRGAALLVRSVSANAAEAAAGAVVPAGAAAAIVVPAAEIPAAMIVVPVAATGGALTLAAVIAVVAVLAVIALGAFVLGAIAPAAIGTAIAGALVILTLVTAAAGAARAGAAVIVVLILIQAIAAAAAALFDAALARARAGRAIADAGVFAVAAPGIAVAAAIARTIVFRIAAGRPVIVGLAIGAPIRTKILVVIAAIELAPAAARDAGAPVLVVIIDAAILSAPVLVAGRAVTAVAAFFVAIAVGRVSGHVTILLVQVGKIERTDFRWAADQTLLVRHQLVLARLELFSKLLHVEPAALGAGEGAVARVFLFADMVFHILAEHGDLRVVIVVVLRAFQQVGDQQFDGVVLDLRLVQIVVFDAFFAAGRIEDLLFDHGMGGQGGADLLDQLLALLAFGALELLEQLLDLAVIGLQQVDGILLFGR